MKLKVDHIPAITPNNKAKYGVEIIDHIEDIKTPPDKVANQIFSHLNLFLFNAAERINQAIVLPIKANTVFIAIKYLKFGIVIAPAFKEGK